MSTSCVLHPRLSNGEKSPLFYRLKEFFLNDRKLAENVYYKAINPAFRKAFPNVRFDHNGEPLLEDLITQCGIGYNKDSESMLNFLNSEYGTKPVPKTIQSVIELQNRAASFNINNPLNKRYSAQLTSSGQDISMEIVEATGEERSLGRHQRFNAELNNQLVKLLNSWGADVAALTELEEASNINGVMDLSAGINAATGLKEVIRISKRHKWSNVSAKQSVLTEEEQRILKSAPRNSKGQLLAPNGKVSNLTEKQYAQVRTKAFKDWFGDWEKIANITEEELQAASLIFDRVPELAKIGTPTEYAAYIKEIFPNSVEKEVYWHGSNEDFSEGFASAKRGEGSGALETKKRNDLYLNKQGWASLQYVNGINRKGRDKNGFAHWNKLWWELKEIMSNGRRENNDWKDIVIDESTIRQAIPNKKGVFNRDSGGKNGKWLSERKADYGYENKSDKEFFEEIFGIKLGKDTFNTWTARNAEIFKSLEKSAKGINPVVIDVRNPITEEGQNTYYEEQRGLFTTADAEGNDAILSKKADNEFNSDVAIVINANNDNVYWLGTKSDIERFRQWKINNNASKVVDENGEPLVVYHNSNTDINIFDKNKIGTNGSSEGGLFGKGFYFSTNKDYNKVFGNKEYAVFLNIKNPITDERTIKEIQAFEPSIDIIKNAYNKDGLIGTNKFENNTVEYIVYDSNQIKSATDNIGTFSRTDDNIIDDTYDSNILAEEWGHFVVDAVKDNPLRDRMLNSLKNEEVLQRVLGSEYDRYNDVYKGDIELMAKEALGKMMAQVLNNYDPTAPNNRLFERYKKSVLDFFSRRDADEIDEIINKVREQVYEFTTNAFNGKYQLDISSRDYNKRLFNLGNDVSRDYNILKRIIQQERKRLAIYGKGAKATAREREEKKGLFDEKQKLFIDKLSNDLENHRELEGIYTYLTEAVRMLKQLSDKLDTVHNSQTNWKDKFSALRSIRDYMSSYGSIMEELRQEMYKAKQEGDMRFKEKLQDSLDEFSGLLARLGSDWVEVSKDEFARFLTPFEGEGISMSIRGKRRKYNIRELLDYIEKDISIVERWTDAMADSTDPILRIYDSLVKDQKNKARYNTINNEKEILMHSKKLEDAGISNTEFMYERTSDGKITGNFVTRYNWGDYFAALSKYAKSLPQDMDREEKSILISRWKRANTDKNGNPIEKYYNPQYDAIQRNAAMKEYYDFMINLKRNLDYRLPAKYVRFNKAPQIRRDFLERVIGRGNKFQYLWESFKDNLVRREDDTEFAYARQDFEGNQIYNLPIYYTRPLKDKNDLSTDCTSTMIAYAAMANDYASMNDIIDALETGRTILSERRVAQTRGGKIMREVLNKVPSNLTKKGDVANFMARLNDFMLMQVYGEQMKDEGTVLGVDVGKAVNMLNKLQSYGTTALSVLTGTANLAQNIVISNIESISGQFFNKSELAKADWEYTKLLPQYLSEIGNRIQTSKMALFAEKLNVLQDYKQHVRGVDWNRKTWFSRFFKEDTLWFTTSAGDHYTQMRTGLALAMRLKLQDKDGKPISLYDALEVQYLDEAHPEYGANLVIKEGVTDQDGKPVSNNYFTSVTKKIRGINNKLYGIYNQEDKSAMQSRAVGRLLMMYRNWMRPLWLKRYGVERYNYDTDTFEEGYYRTLWNFMNTLRKDLKKGELDIVKQWHNLDDAQKSNIYRGLAEIATFLSLMGIIAILKGIPDDDDKDDWLTEYVTYSIIRLKADLGSLMPGPTMLDEGLRLFDNPFAAVRVLKNTRQLLNLFDPDVWTTEIDQGIYKGYTKAEKIMLQPVPFIRQFQNLFDPEEPARWYK